MNKKNVLRKSGLYLAALLLANCSGHDICFKEEAVVETGVVTELVPGSIPAFELDVFLFSFSSESTLAFFGFCNLSRLLSSIVCLRFNAILTTEVEGREFKSPSCPDDVVVVVVVGVVAKLVKPCPERSFFEVMGGTVDLAPLAVESKIIDKFQILKHTYIFDQNIQVHTVKCYK